MRMAMIAGFSLLIAAGCARIDADMMLGHGTVRVEPHPASDGSSRVSMLTVPDAPISFSNVDPNRPDGRARLLATIFSPDCAFTEEGRVALAPTALGLAREQLVFRVACPAGAAR